MGDRSKKLLFLSLSLLISVLCSLSWFLFPGFSSSISEDLPEATGVICLALFGLTMAVYVADEILKRKWYPQGLKKQLVYVTRQLHFFHIPLSLLGFGFSILHLLSSLSNHEGVIELFKGGVSEITGYVLLGLTTVSVMAGLLVKLNRRFFRTLHVWAAILAIIPLVIHLMD